MTIKITPRTVLFAFLALLAFPLIFLVLRVAFVVFGSALIAALRFGLALLPFVAAYLAWRLFVSAETKANVKDKITYIKRALSRN